MDYKIKSMAGFKVMGFTREFDAETSYTEIPKFWGEICKKYEKEIAENIIGEYGVCIDDLDGSKFRYMIAGLYNGGEVPEGMSVYELPDFDWAVLEATAKKKLDFSKVEFFTYDEGLCVQCMHVGAYDDEPATVEAMHGFMEEQGYILDITDQRYHHEIYLSDARKAAPEKLKTVIRHPIKARE